MTRSRRLTVTLSALLLAVLPLAGTGLGSGHTTVTHRQTVPQTTPWPGPTTTQGAPDPSGLAPALFDVAWDDPTPFLGDLVDPAPLERLQSAPVHHLQFDLQDDGFTIVALQQSRITNRSDDTWTEVVVRLLPNILGGDMRVEEALLDGVVTPARSNGDGTALRLTLPEPLPPGERVVLDLAYALELPATTRVGYGRLARYPDVVSIAHAYAVLATYEDGSWDARVPPDHADPLHAESAFFLVRILAPADMHLVASGRLLERRLSGDRQEAVFAAGPMRDAYVTASRDYESVRTHHGPTVIRSHAPLEARAGSERALDISRDAFEVFTRRFGPYPYREYDIVAVPVAAGGIEFPGIVNVATRYYLLAGDEFFETIVAHEAAHQWFFGVVGSDPLLEPWLDEALTQYATLLYYRDVHGEARAERFRATLDANWERVGRAPIPIGLPARAYTPTEYGAIVYGRGPLFFLELERHIGEATLMAALRAYYREHAFEIATGEDLRVALEEACECDLAPLFEAWVWP